MTTTTIETPDYIMYDNSILTENEIKVTSGVTCFCSIKKYHYPTINDLTKRVKVLRKQFKDAKVKLNKSNTLTILKEKEAFTQAVKEYNDTYNTLLNNWTYAINNNALQVGYGDDQYYLNNLREPYYKTQEMNNVNNILNKIKQIENRVNELEESIRYGEINNYINVSI